MSRLHPTPAFTTLVYLTKLLYRHLVNTPTTAEQNLLFIGFPLLGTLALHAVVIYLLTVNWQPQHDVLVQPKQVSRVIDARLIDAEALKPKPKPQPQP